MVYLIVALIVIGIIISIFNFVKKNIGIILGIVGIVLLFIFVPVVAVIVILGLVLAIIIASMVAKKNERDLRSYLSFYCTQLGYVPPVAYSNVAPAFAGKYYSTSYEEIVKNFLAQCDSLYFNQTDNGRWAQPMFDYVKEHGMADVLQLIQVPNPAWKLTHITTNQKLAYDAMNTRCYSSDSNTTPDFERIQLQEEVVKQELEGTGYPFCEAFCYAYKSTAKLLESNAPSNFISEEISIDDL